MAAKAIPYPVEQCDPSITRTQLRMWLRIQRDDNSFGLYREPSRIEATVTLLKTRLLIMGENIE